MAASPESGELNPFQSPQAVELAESPARMLPGRKRAMLAVACLAAVVVIRLACAATNYIQIAALHRVQAGGVVSRAEVETYAMLRNVLIVVHFTVFVASAVTFIGWSHRAYANLRRLGNRTTDYSPGWTIGGWFIPIGSFFVPYLVMAEIWNCSHPANVRTLYPRRGPGISLVRLWWAFWLGMLFLSYAASPPLGGRPTSLDAAFGYLWTGVIRDLVAMPGSLLAILVVRSVDAHQMERQTLFDRLKASMPDATLDNGSFYLGPSPGNAPGVEAGDFPFLPPEESAETSDGVPSPWLEEKR